MTFHPIPGAVEVQIHATADGQELLNTIGFNTHEAADLTVLNHALDAVSAFVTNYGLLCTSRVHFYLLRAIALDTPGSPIVDRPIDQTGAITEANAMPLSVAAVLSMRPNVRGRGRKGRIFLFGLTEADVDGDTINSGYISDMTDTVNGSLVGAFDWGAWAVLSRAHAGANDVQDFHIDPIVGVQKDRLPGHRRHRRP